MQQFRIIIKGRVQGVFFRDFARKLAMDIGIKGTVENKKDGTVEIIAQGGDYAIDDFIEGLREGPVGAKVEDIEMEEEYDIGEYADFEIIY